MPYGGGIDPDPDFDSDFDFDFDFLDFLDPDSNHELPRTRTPTRTRTRRIIVYVSGPSLSVPFRTDQAYQPRACPHLPSAASAVAAGLAGTGDA
ncbi:MAG: hypothetical protein ACOX52_18435 [Verrucomicrobiota bacterium]